MQNRIYYCVKIIVCFLGQISVAFAVTYTVNVNTDTNPGGGGSGSGTTGDLRYCLTQLNASGTSGTIQFNFGVNTTITVAANLPIITQTVTLQPTNGTTVTTINGASQYRLLATSNASLTLQNMILQNGKAKGDGYPVDISDNNVATGGGMGAGGGVYIDIGKTLTMTNSKILSCS
ncbi:MAG TPA: hypothetical protein VLG38_05680, partial [Gammaproteobacteria bacterium]|nr:hypothetical protein [Gammaproteobacteria bacterium]